jgi:lipoprotein LprG
VRRLRVAAAAALTLLALATTACSGDSEGPQDEPASAAEVMAAAKERLDGAVGIRMTLTSTGIPETISALTGGTGVLTHAPAFEGELTVQTLGMTPRVPVVAVDGVVHAQLPFTTGFQAIDPAAYGAPDPAQLADPDTGLSSMLTATTDVEAGESVRGGEGNKEVLTTYTGTLPGSKAASLVPSVTGDVAATYTINEDAEVSTVELTGDFYGTGGTETYTITIDAYDVEQEITAP